MTGKAYYITTLSDWQRHAPRYANSHFIVLDAPVLGPSPSGPAPQQSTLTVECGSLLPPLGAGACSGTTEVSASEEALAKPASQADGSDIPGASNITELDSEASAPTAILAKPRSTAEQARPANSGGEPPHSTNTASLEGQGFGPDKSDAPQAPSDAQLHPQHVVDVSSVADRDSSGGQSFGSYITDGREAPSLLPQAVAEPPAERHDSSVGANRDTATRILVLIEADEGVHLSLDDDPAFEALPHPLAQKPISPAAQSALAPHGVAPGATTFDAAEALARVHPLLRHRVF